MTSPTTSRPGQSTALATAVSEVAVARPARDRRAITLAVVLCAQLMIVLDMTVVNVALPSMATGLHLSATGLSWVLNAYTLTFGGLLLLGGRAGDVLGRRTVFMAGLGLFTLASLAGGLASSAGILLAARAVQGVGAAVATPAVLATIISSFPEGRERVRALGAFTAVAMGGASLGLVLGGLLTQWASWRWVFFVNVPVGAAVLIAAPMLLARTGRRPGKLDLAGALTSTAGMSSLVYAFINAASAGWGSRTTIAAMAAAVVLLAAFGIIETRAAEPVTPLGLFRDRSRAASYLARLLLVAGMFGMFFFLTQYVQEVLGFSPLRAGLAFVPMTGAVLATSRLAPRLVPAVGGKRLLVAGLIPVVGGMFWLSQLSTGMSYFPGVLLPMLLLGTGLGIAFVPLTMASLAGVPPRDSGAASSMVNVMQQVGGSLGLAILVTIYGSARRSAAQHAAHALAHSTAAEQARYLLVHGVTIALRAATILDVLALVVVVLAVRFAPQPGHAAACGRGRNRVLGLLPPL